MPKWADRARGALNRGQSEITKEQLEETARAASTVGRDIRFLLESAGRKLNSDPEPTPDSLTVVERHYRELARMSTTDREAIRTLEWLMSLLLGETLIRVYGGRWVVYGGRYHTGSPIVVWLDRFGKVFDVSLIPRDLHENRSLLGSREGRALARSVERAEKLVF